MIPVRIEQVDSDARTVQVLFTEDELIAIANALNEVCNGIDIEDPEFATRLGVERWEAKEVLAQVGAALDALPGQP